MEKGESRRGREEVCFNLCSTGLSPSVASKYLHFRLDIYGVQYVTLEHVMSDSKYREDGFRSRLHSYIYEDLICCELWVNLGVTAERN